MTSEEVVAQLREKFLLPYSEDTEWVEKRIRLAAETWAGWGARMEFLLQIYSHIFQEVLHANARLLLESGKGTEMAGEFVSPTIDFSNPEVSLSSFERLSYQLQLETMIWNEIDGWVSDENIGGEDVLSVPVFYDIWLQALLICEEPKNELERIAP